MKRILKIVMVALAVIFIAIQFIPAKRNESDVVSKSDFLLVNNTPENIGKLLRVSCYDCHSNNTKYPWYYKVQPVAWFLEDHIEEGKKELNFSEWTEYSDRRKNSKLKSIISQIEDNEMPPFSYTLLHRDAVYSQFEKELVIQYLNKMRDSIQ